MWHTFSSRNITEQLSGKELSYLWLHVCITTKDHVCKYATEESW